MGQLISSQILPSDTSIFQTRVSNDLSDCNMCPDTCNCLQHQKQRGILNFFRPPCRMHNNNTSLTPNQSCKNCLNIDSMLASINDQSQTWYNTSVATDFDMHHKFPKEALITSLLNCMKRVDLVTRSKNLHTKYDSITVPDVSVKDYAQRLIKYFKCPPICFLIALIYVHKIITSQKIPQIDSKTEQSQDSTAATFFTVLDPLNAHRMLVTAFTIAVKSYDDKFLVNSYYAHVGGLRVEELNKLESRMLKMLDFRTLINRTELNNWVNLCLMNAIDDDALSSASVGSSVTENKSVHDNAIQAYHNAIAATNNGSIAEGKEEDVDIFDGASSTVASTVASMMIMPSSSSTSLSSCSAATSAVSSMMKEEVLASTRASSSSVSSTTNSPIAVAEEEAPPSQRQAINVDDVDFVRGEKRKKTVSFAPMAEVIYTW